MADKETQKHKIELVVSIKQKTKRKQKTPKKERTLPKKEKILRNFLLLLAVSINTATGIESAVDAKNIIKKMDTEFPDKDSSRKFADTAKKVFETIKNNKGKDVLSLSLLLYQVYNTVKSSYLLIVGRDKITTQQFKLININGIIQNALGRGLKYAINGR